MLNVGRRKLIALTREDRHALAVVQDLCRGVQLLGRWQIDRRNPRLGAARAAIFHGWLVFGQPPHLHILGNRQMGDAASGQGRATGDIGNDQRVRGTRDHRVDDARAAPYRARPVRQ
jgi:hypothetical protein